MYLYKSEICVREQTRFVYRQNVQIIYFFIQLSEQYSKNFDKKKQNVTGQRYLSDTDAREIIIKLQDVSKKDYTK